MAVVGFDDCQVLRAEMPVCLFTGKDRKQKRQVGVIRVQQIQLAEVGEDIKTIQELLRHSNYKVTADTYTQAVTSTKRAAQAKLVKMILLPR